MRLRNNLPQYLEASGLTEPELATLAGIDRTYVNRIKNGIHTPTIVTVLRIAKALNATADALFYLDEASETELKLRARPELRTPAAAP